MSARPRSAPGKPARVSPITKTASNSRPLAWWIVITCTPVRSGGDAPSPRKPISASPASRVARPRTSSAGSAAAISRARRSSGREGSQPAGALGAAGRERGRPQAAPVDFCPEGVGGRQVGRGAARLLEKRGEGGRDPDERPRHRPAGRGGGRHRVGGLGPGHVEAPVGGDAQVGLGVGRVGGGASHATAERTSRRSKRPKRPRTWCARPRARGRRSPGGPRGGPAA